MQQIAPNLWQSEKYSTGILNTHAYLLQRDSTNVLFYNTAAPKDLIQIAQLGGVGYQMLTHRDEAGASLLRNCKQFGSTLVCSELERAYITKHCPVDLTLDCHISQVEDIQIIHTPGHTDGSICYFYQPHNGASYLFTGDTFFPWDTYWRTFVMESAGGSVRAMIDSLKILQTLRPDYVFSSGFIGELAFSQFDEASWLAVLEREITQLKSKLTN